MKKSIYRSSQIVLVWVLAVCIFSMPMTALAQTRISYHSNSYSPNDDVKAGQQAAAQVEQQMPILRDQVATDYLRSIGDRLVSAIPPEFQHPEFRYSFKIVDVRDINAFALPGGPMYVNRGLINVAHNEGELAGVMAHELSHVALRHGTAQATKAQKYSILGALGQVAGAVVGGVPGAVIGQGSQLGVGAYFLKFSREYETEADVLGSQIMARAGYDPIGLANMFKTLEQQGSGGGPQFLSDHPNPANRFARIQQERDSLARAGLLRNSNQYNNNPEFGSIQARLRGMGNAPSSSEVARNGQRNPQSNYPSNSNINSRVAYPSGRFRTYTEGNLFRISVPDNWRELQDSNANSVTFAPDGAYDSQGQFTHGILAGLAQTQSGNLQQATQDYINSLAQGNQRLRQQGGFQRGSISGRDAIAVSFSNTNEVTGRPETVSVYTTMLSNGYLFYVVAVAPQNDYRNYQGTFQQVLRSIQLNG
jgi:hypothetical protein